MSLGREVMAVSRVEGDKLAVHMDLLGRNSFFRTIRNVHRASKSFRRPEARWKIRDRDAIPPIFEFSSSNLSYFSSFFFLRFSRRDPLFYRQSLPLLVEISAKMEMQMWKERRKHFSIRFIQQDFHKRKETWSVGWQGTGISLNRAFRSKRKILSMATFFHFHVLPFFFLSCKPHMSHNHSV